MYSADMIAAGQRVPSSVYAQGAVQCLLLCDTVRRVSRTVTHVLYSIVAATMGMHEPSLPLLPPLPPLLAAGCCFAQPIHLPREGCIWLHGRMKCMAAWLDRQPCKAVCCSCTILASDAA